LPNPTVFLSYSRSDEIFINRLATDLRECQINAWYDKWEIQPGQSLVKRILEEAIPRADAFFVYLTPQSIKSKWVKDELETALVEAKRYNLRILTFVDCEKTLSYLPSYLLTKKCQIINNDDYELGIRKIIKSVSGAAHLKQLRALEKKVSCVFQPTLRKGKTLIDSIKETGLVDIENRDDESSNVPPSKFYNLAINEVFISGLTLERTFDLQINMLHKILDKNIRLFLLLLHPKAEIIPWLSKREKRDLESIINKNVIEVAQREKITEYPNFRMRLMKKFPSFSAIMLDGDIEKNEEQHLSNIYFRIQPTTIYKSHHNGLVIQLEKLKETPNSIFDFIYDELCQQWNNSIKLETYLLNK